MVAIIAAIPPVTVGTYGYFSKEKEVAIADAEQKFTMRVAYLDRAIDPGKSDEARRRVLRFLFKVMPSDDPVHAWAQEELKSVESAIAERQQKIEQLTEALDAAAQHEQDAIAALAKEHSEDIERLKAGVRVATSKRLEAESRLRSVGGAMAKTQISDPRLCQVTCDGSGGGTRATLPSGYAYSFTLAAKDVPSGSEFHVLSRDRNTNIFLVENEPVGSSFAMSGGDALFACTKLPGTAGGCHWGCSSDGTRLTMFTDQMSAAFAVTCSPL